MAYRTLRDFVEALDQAGELHRITAPVSPILEITAIADRISKSPAAASEHAVHFDPLHAHLGGKALLLENVQGTQYPVLINAFGSYRRMEMALGCTEGGFSATARKVASLIKPEPPVGVVEKVKKGIELVKVANMVPRRVRSGPCQEVIKQADEINLFDFPILKCWPDDGDPHTCGYPVSAQQAGTALGNGRYITFGGVFTIHPDDAGKPPDQPRTSRNIGMYRAQLIDRNHTAMHWHMHHDGARHWRAWKQAQQGPKTGIPEIDDVPGMPAAIVLGAESVLPYAATAPLPPGISELLFAGFLNNSAIPTVRCKTIDLDVPANADIVIEGYVSTECGEIGFDPHLCAGRDRTEAATSPMSQLGPGAVLEGPFGDHTGYYSLPDRYPIFTVTAITHCRNPIYPTTIVGYPPQEDYFLGKATERIFLPLLQTLIPDIIDYDLPMFGAFHNCAFVQIDKQYPLQARRVMHAIWGAGQMAWTKFIVVVDSDIDIHDHEQVLFCLCANCDPGRDVEVVSGPLDILDHAAPRLGGGHKMGLDATRKITGEEVGGHPVRDWPQPMQMSDSILSLVQRRWGEYGL